MGQLFCFYQEKLSYVLLVAGYNVITLNVTPVYATNHKSRIMQGLLQASESPLKSSFKRINKNEVQCKLCKVNLAYHKSTMHSYLRARRAIQSVELSTDLSLKGVSLMMEEQRQKGFSSLRC